MGKVGSVHIGIVLDVSVSTPIGQRVLSSVAGGFPGFIIEVSVTRDDGLVERPVLFSASGLSEFAAELPVE